MSWIVALKQYNDSKGGAWILPRKGSEEYEAVRSIQSKLPPMEKKTRKRKRKVVATSATPSDEINVSAEKTKRAYKKRANAVSDVNDCVEKDVAEATIQKSPKTMRIRVIGEVKDDTQTITKKPRRSKKDTDEVEVAV